jgi:cytoskeletal protein RodZ
MAKKRKNKLTKLSKSLVIVVLVLVLGVGAYALLHNKQNGSSSSSNKSGNSSPNSNINYGPPTDAEKQETQSHKDELSQNNPPSPPPTSSGKKAVTPVITSATHSQINAYVPGIFEDGGTCTATLTKGSNKITKSSQGFANVSYTSCVPIDVSASGGTWTITVVYNSKTAEGSSQATQVK